MLAFEQARSIIKRIVEIRKEQKMSKLMGQVYSCDKVTRAGVIVSRDKQQYRFSAKDCLSSELREGNIVEFEADGQNTRKVRLLTDSSI